MAELVGTISGVVGIATATLHSIRILSNEISNIKHASETIASIQVELRNVQSVVETLETALHATDLRTEFDAIAGSGNLKEALRACTDACDRFHEELQNLLRHSPDASSKLAWRDRFAVGVLGRDRVAAFTSELRLCKSTVGLALNGTNFIVALEQYKQLQTLVQRDSQELARRNGDTSLSDISIHNEELAVNIERGVRLSDGYGELLTVLQSKVAETSTVLEMGKVEMLNSKGAAGITNADGTEGSLKVKIGDVKTQDAKVVVGYSKDVNFDAIFS